MKHLKYIFALFAILLLDQNLCLAQCANNNSSQGGNISIATQGVAQNSGCINAGRYARVTVVAGETYTFSTCIASWDTEMTLYANSGGGALAFDDDGCGNTNGGSSITWVATFSGTLRILIDGNNCSSPNECAVISLLWVSYPIPSNDLCANAIAVACGSSISGTTNGASIDAMASCGTTISTGGVWYVLIGTGELFTVSLCGSTFDTKLDVYEGSCATLLCVGGNNNYSPCGTSSQYNFATDSGETYYILIHGNGSGKGTFNLSLTCSSPTYNQQDCEASLQICTDETVGGNSDAFGLIQELNIFNSNCLTTEHQSGWFYFQPLTTGTIEFTIVPTSGIDYDFAIWGPYTTLDCPPQEEPIRCSYSSLYVPTGLVLNSPEGDISEPPSGDAWVEAITIAAADLNKLYLMVIDNYTADYTAFELNWNLTGVTLACQMMLPVEFSEFYGISDNKENLLFWQTTSEINNSHFDIERSSDGLQFEKVSIVEGSGTSSSTLNYQWTDAHRPLGTVYYRLKQVDFNGDYDYSSTISLYSEAPILLQNIFPNPSSGNFAARFNSAVDGLVIVRITDISGRPISNQEISIRKGFHTTDIEAIELPKGYYILIVEDSKGVVFGREKIAKY